jgi:outer membrane protein assembly factor BamE (lipoprotein component of BamABCDE complex)
MVTQTRSRPFARSAAAAVVLALAIVLAACSRVEQQGSTVEADRIARIVPKVHTAADVAAILGSPSSVAPLGDTTWYYVSGRAETIAFLPKEHLDRQVVVIRFDERNVVQAVETFGLEKGREVALVGRETPTFGQDLSIVQEFLRNVGRFEGQEQQERQ